MDRQAYNTCMRPHMTGKGLTQEERHMKVCVGAKLCTGKAKTEGEARKICQETMGEKKPRLPRRRKKGEVTGLLKAYLLTTDNCTPCNLLREKLKKPLAKGEVVEINATKNPDQAKQLIKDHKAKTPSVLVVSSDGTLIASS